MDTVILGAADWRGPELASSTVWIDRITDEQARELTGTVESLMAEGRLMAGVTATEFQIPSLAGDLVKARDALETGSGIHLFRGLPVEDLPIDAVRTMYWGIGSHLGTAVSQSKRGDFLGDVREEAKKAKADRKGLEKKVADLAVKEEQFEKKREYDELRKKALECMYAVASSLPAEMQLQTMNFNDRKESNQNLSMTGSVPTDLDQLVATFKNEMVSIEVKDVEEKNIRLFDNVLEGSIQEIKVGSDPVKRWTLNCSLVMNREKRKRDK